MNKQELSFLLKNTGVSSSLFSLDGGLPNEKLCLNHIDGLWEIYYSERGCKTGIEIFDNESDACESLLKKINMITNGSYR